MATREKRVHLQGKSSRGKLSIHQTEFPEEDATLFDPVGFLAPFTIRAKVMLQEMWAT